MKNEDISNSTSPIQGLRISGTLEERRNKSTHCLGANNTNAQGAPIQKKKRGEVYTQFIIAFMVAFDSVMRFVSRNPRLPPDHPNSQWMEYSFIYIVCVAPILLFGLTWWIGLGALFLFGSLNASRHS